MASFIILLVHPHILIDEQWEWQTTREKLWLQVAMIALSAMSKLNWWIWILWHGPVDRTIHSLLRKFQIFMRSKIKMSFQVHCATTPQHQHQKQLISLAANIPGKSSLNTKMMLGDNWELWQRDVIDMDQFHSAMKQWSLVVVPAAAACK